VKNNIKAKFAKSLLLIMSLSLLLMLLPGCGNCVCDCVSCGCEAANGGGTAGGEDVEYDLNEYSYGKPLFPNVSLTATQLMANPEKYDGKLIQIRGVINLSKDNTTLYSSKEDWHYNNEGFYISLDYDALGVTEEELKVKNGDMVMIEGKFEMWEDSFLYWYGAITDIHRIVKLLSKDEYKIKWKDRTDIIWDSAGNPIGIRPAR